MKGMSWLRQISGVEKQDMQLIGIFFGALAASQIMPYVVFGNFRGLMSAKAIFFTLAFAGSITGILFRMREASPMGFAAMTAGAYTLAYAVFRIAFLEWSVMDAMWGLAVPFAQLFTLLAVITFALTLEFAPTWAMLIAGWVVGKFASVFAGTLTYAIVEERTPHFGGAIKYFFKYGLVSAGAAAVVFAGIMFAVHKTRNTGLAKL